MVNVIIRITYTETDCQIIKLTDTYKYWFNNNMKYWRLKSMKFYCILHNSQGITIDKVSLGNSKGTVKITFLLCQWNNSWNNHLIKKLKLAAVAVAVVTCQA